MLLNNQYYQIKFEVILTKKKIREVQNNLIIIENIFLSMGNTCKLPSQIKETQIQSEFTNFKPNNKKILIPHHYHKILDRIKMLKTFIDPRENPNLKWFQSVKQKYYLYGTIKSNRPSGECLVYAENLNENDLPVIVATEITQMNMFSEKTLILYANSDYYIGQIHCKSYQLPKANGIGMLVTRDFIYEGQFKNGLPNGYGVYKTKYLQFAGQFKDGSPAGQGVQRSQKGLFIGKIEGNSQIGYLITPQNKKTLIEKQIKLTNKINLDVQTKDVDRQKKLA